LINYGVNVVICGTKNDYQGMSIAWVSYVEKKHIVVSMPRSSSITERVLSEGKFSVCVLAEDQSNIARQYGGGAQIRKVVQDNDLVECGEWDIPMIKACCTKMLCEICIVKHINKQTIVIAEVVDKNEIDALVPLVYNHADYFE